MMDTKTPDNQKDFLNSRIDALLNNEGISDNVQGLSPEERSLLVTAEKVITQAERYPGTSTPTAQQRLAVMTAYRMELKNNKAAVEKPKRWLSVFQNTTVRWAAAVSIALLVTVGVLLATPSNGSTILSGAAGQQSNLYPLLLLALLGLGVILYLIFRRKK